MKKMRIVEWNLHGMTGTGVRGNKYSFPVDLICDSIRRINCPEVVAFTEFTSGSFDSEDEGVRQNALELQEGLKGLGYSLIMTKPLKRRNGICFAIKTSSDKAYSENDSFMTKLCEGDEKSPDYLAVGNETVVIFGVRFPSNVSNSQIRNWFETISRYKDKKVIVIGDFNRTKVKLINNLEFKSYNRKVEKADGLGTLRIHECDDSGIGKGAEDLGDHEMLDQNMFSILDYVITNFDTNVKVEYSWDFMKNLYDDVKNRATYINMRCIPDHAMLIAEVEI